MDQPTQPIQPVQPTVPPQPPQTPPPSHSLNWLKTLSIGFGIVSFCIAIAIIGYFITSNKTNSAKTQTATTKPTPTTPPAGGPTANWKTYNDSSFNFSFKYPPELSIQSSQSSETNFVNENKTQTLFVKVWPPTNSDFVSTFCEQIKPNPEFKSTCTITTINGHKAAVTLQTNKLIQRKDVNIQLSENETVNLLAETTNQDQSFFSTFDQILSTFKFTK